MRSLFSKSIAWFQGLLSLTAFEPCCGRRSTHITRARALPLLPGKGTTLFSFPRDNPPYYHLKPVSVNKEPQAEFGKRARLLPHNRSYQKGSGCQKKGGGGVLPHNKSYRGNGGIGRGGAAGRRLPHNSCYRTGRGGSHGGNHVSSVQRGVSQDTEGALPSRQAPRETPDFGGGQCFVSPISVPYLPVFENPSGTLSSSAPAPSSRHGPIIGRALLVQRAAHRSP